MLAQPPYSLAPTAFRFRALASLAGRLPIGGEREIALAAFVAVRLAGSAIGARALPEELRKTRALGARQWMGALTLPPALRLAVSQLADASSTGDHAVLAICVDRVATLVAALLDVASRAELRQLAAALRDA